MIENDSAQRILDDFVVTADAVQARVLEGLSWSATAGHRGQHQGDVDADEIGLAVLTSRGFDVFSEESGYSLRSSAGRPGGNRVIAVIDPVDGSTNASKGIPFYSISLCAIIGGTLEVALVRNLASGDTYAARRGSGSTKNGNIITPSGVVEVSKSIVGLNGHASQHLGWAQYRALGAASLELCLVAEGALDAYIDLSVASLASWDILGGVLICREAGAHVLERDAEHYQLTDLEERKAVVAAGTLELAQSLARKAWQSE